MRASHARFERGERTPTLKRALGCEIIFGIAPRSLFPGLYDQVEEAVMNRAARLYQELEGRADARSTRKRDLLDDMMKRASHRPAV